MKTKSIQKTLKPLLSSWKKVTEDYAKRVPGEGDCTYWYRERPHVGFLAVAAWRTVGGKGVALEEWGAIKGSHRKPSKGRNDLWIALDGEEFFIEAKHCWCDAYKSKKAFSDQLLKCIEAAKSSAHRIVIPRGNKSARKLAAVFVSAMWKAPRSPEHSSRAEALKLWENICRNETGTDLVEVVSDAPSDDKSECIGIALLLFEVQSK